ncbi:MAG: hypothetical protein IT430_00170 [Phycisphaerales bacterium]|nr:hypothetical protein [Phycisphaerales bacterium]
MAKGWFRNAFAVDPPGPAEPTEEQKPVVEWACREIARRRMAMPGVVLLEMTRPLNYVAASTMHVFQPVFWSIMRQQTYDNYRHFSTFLEQRGSMEYMINRIEELEAEAEAKKREAKKAE